MSRRLLSLPARSGQYPMAYRTVLFPNQPLPELKLGESDMMLMCPVAPECVFDLHSKVNAGPIALDLGIFLLSLVGFYGVMQLVYGGVEAPTAKREKYVCIAEDGIKFKSDALVEQKLKQFSNKEL